jgi:hypothetical protein
MVQEPERKKAAKSLDPGERGCTRKSMYTHKAQAFNGSDTSCFTAWLSHHYAHSTSSRLIYVKLIHLRSGEVHDRSCEHFPFLAGEFRVMDLISVLPHAECT